MTGSGGTTSGMGTVAIASPGATGEVVFSNDSRIPSTTSGAKRPEGASPLTPGLWTLPGLTRPVDGYGSKKPLPQPPTGRLGISDEAGDSHSPLENADEPDVFHERPQALPISVPQKPRSRNTTSATESATM